MKAVVWQGPRTIGVEEVPDPVLEQETDIIIRITSSAICGSDLHLYEAMKPFMHNGDILGHEPMGIVEEVGKGVTRLQRGDRVVVPFNIACGYCFFCKQGLYSQCETTQVREHGTGAALFGYSEMYGRVPGGQAEYLRVPHADFGPVKVPEGPVDDRFLFLSDVLPTAWQAVEYASVPGDGTLLVLGLGPVGHMAVRVAQQRGIERIIAVEPVPERAQRGRAEGVTVIEEYTADAVVGAVEDLTEGRGADSVIDAVGMEAKGSPLARTARAAVSVLPRPAGKAMMKTVGIDQLAALQTSIATVRRGGTISLIGVYGGMADPLPMLTLFDKQVTLRMGQANVRRWIDDLLPLVLDDADPLGTENLATHHIPIDQAPAAYEALASKKRGTIKVVLQP